MRACAIADALLASSGAPDETDTLATLMSHRPSESSRRAMLMGPFATFDEPPLAPLLDDPYSLLGNVVRVRVPPCLTSFDFGVKEPGLRVLLKGPGASAASLPAPPIPAQALNATTEGGAKNKRSDAYPPGPVASTTLGSVELGGGQQTRAGESADELFARFLRNTGETERAESSALFEARFAHLPPWTIENQFSYEILDQRLLHAFVYSDLENSVEGPGFFFRLPRDLPGSADLDFDPSARLNVTASLAGRDHTGSHWTMRLELKGL